VRKEEYYRGGKALSWESDAGFFVDERGKGGGGGGQDVGSRLIRASYSSLRDLKGEGAREKKKDFVDKEWENYRRPVIGSHREWGARTKEKGGSKK